MTQAPELRVRARTDADVRAVAGWVPDAQALFLFTGSRLVWPLTGEQLSSMSASGEVSAWVMVDERSVLLGHFDLTLQGDAARLGRVIVDPSRRGRGYGGALVEFAIETARALGMKALTLNVIADNAPAIAAYERAGFGWLSSGDRAGVWSMRLTL